MNEPLIYTGGALETHAYLIPAKTGGCLCFDAPEGAADLIRKKGLKIDALLLTHGHFDHIWDAGRIEADQGCPVYIHAADLPLASNIDYLSHFGIADRFPLVKTFLDLPVPSHGHMPWAFGGHQFDLYHIPGHSAGSVAFHEKEAGRIVGGDILFAGGVGRWDLPGGSQHDLIEGITRHLLPLPDNTLVYPGHGPSTTIGNEKRTNRYLQARAG